MIKGRNQKGIISASGTRYLSLEVSVHFMFDCLYGIYILHKTTPTIWHLAACQSVSSWVTPKPV